jgi:CRISPR-associated protein Csm4
VSLPGQTGANTWLTLGPCAPQGLDLDPQRSFYQVFTRFGRHGDMAVHTGRPFKTPVLLAQTAAVLVPKQYQQRFFVGAGLGGDGSISKAIPETVHQGYAPVVGIRLPVSKEV